LIQITDHAEGCILSVRAQPGARRNAILGEHGGALRVAVTAPPDKGRANDAIIEVLADALDLKRAQIDLISGPTSRQKRFLVRNMTAEALRNKLQALLQV
jgi:uncharacterized protein (TIGR00251 family)